MKHTPWPWRAGTRLDYPHITTITGGGTVIADILPAHLTRSAETVEADTALITAAPDLLKALLSIAALEKPTKKPRDGMFHTQTGLNAAANIAKDAIAKVGGSASSADTLKPADHGFAKPDGLDESGEKAFAIIEAWRIKSGFHYTGGCKTYYSPQAWIDRGESYGIGSKLIIVHDGGDFSEGDHGSPLERDQELHTALAAAGLYLECCTNWYHAAYLI